MENCDIALDQHISGNSGSFFLFQKVILGKNN